MLIIYIYSYHDIKISRYEICCFGAYSYSIAYGKTLRVESNQRELMKFICGGPVRNIILYGTVNMSQIFLLYIKK